MIYGEFCQCTNFACPRHDALICGGKLIGTALFLENAVSVLLNNFIVTINSYCTMCNKPFGVRRKNS